MKTRIVVDGEMRLRKSPELQAKLRALRESIRARHAAELSSARFFRRCIIRWQMAREYRRERRHIVPSSQSLYSSGIVAGSTHEDHTTGKVFVVDKASSKELTKN